MAHICLVHWNANEGEKSAQRLRAAGHDVDLRVPRGPEFLRALEARPPVAVLIDLSRAPSQGRDLALALRQRKSTRHVPIVFVGGEAEKVDALRQLLPDAIFATWRGIAGALHRAAEPGPSEPVAPSVFAGYSGTPLPKKLGIKDGTQVLLIGAPEDFARTLGPVPEGAALHFGRHRNPDLVLWFVRTRQDLLRGVVARARGLKRGSMWIVWPKKTSALASDLSETGVREAGLATGMVDYKVCAVDATWSGLLFTRRKS